MISSVDISNEGRLRGGAILDIDLAQGTFPGSILKGIAFVRC
jgi:hypothetical protein